MASLNIPYSFTNGTPSNATEVNADFNAVKSFVESQVVSVDGAVQAPTAAIADSAVTNAKINYSSVPQTTVATTDPTGGKDGDIWVKVV